MYRHRPQVTNFLSFLARDQCRQSRAGKIGLSCLASSGPVFASVSLISKLTTSCSICILFSLSSEISPSPGSFTSYYFSLPSLWSATCSKLTCYSPWFSAKCPRYTVVAETHADGLNACCPLTRREETIWMFMFHKFAAAYSVIWSP